ncbi:MAG: carboxypeptidase regulatory-like domain-containing protein [Candidatus Cloacimonetes bacterium]|nr:carboxypeptidase regulatory-like domain-containing protein [Candidatus Cloacimonadota bacterium]
MIPVLLTAVFVQFGPRVDMGIIEYGPLSEISGIICSRENTNVIWAHNDSGDESRIYALNTGGDHLGIFTLTGAVARDWEDIAIGPGPLDGVDYLYLGDIGDNNLQYDNKFIFRVAEPYVEEDQAPEEMSIGEYDIITFQYPQQQKYDAETLMIDPLNGDIYVISKRTVASSDRVFRLAYPQSTTDIIIAEEIGELQIPSGEGYGATAGDISNSGLEIIIKTYTSVYYWNRSPGMSISQTLATTPAEVYYVQEPQGEALAWKANSMGYYTSGEEPQIWLPAHLYFYPRLDNYIYITELPSDLYKQNEQFEIQWEPEELTCSLQIASSPGGEDPENYGDTGMEGSGYLIATPAQIGMGTGVYYCVLSNATYGYVSVEFTLIVESGDAVEMLIPENGSTVTEAAPLFNWESNPGVPYYYIVVSDNPFTIEEDENGEPVVVGLQPVWQIITPYSSALYGSPDPSGYFENLAQPLVQGIEYNWIVANNYGNDPLLTSKVVPSPFSFFYDSGCSIPSPELIYPADQVILNEEEITFQWTQVDVADNYQIYIYETREENGNIGNYLIWDQITTNTYCDFDAVAILINADYVWKVMATDENGTSSVSENFGFFYEIEIGTLHLSVQNIYGSPIGFATAELDPVDGSQDNVPLAVNAEGNEVKVVPPGEYVLTCSKEGYEDTDTLITIFEDLYPDSPEGDTFITVFLELSPSVFYGEVVDNNNVPVENSVVGAINISGELRTADAPSGYFYLGVTPGMWTISADAAGYTLLAALEEYILPGENLELPDLIMIPNEKDIEGHVLKPGGTPVAGAIINADNDQICRSVSTNSSGYFRLYGLNFGAWSVSAYKEGYIEASPFEVNINNNSPPLITLPDFILTPPANLVIGNVNNSVVALPGALIRAQPLYGQSCYTESDVYGDYTLNLESGTFWIEAFLENYTAQDIYQLSLDVGETADNIDFMLLPNTGRIEGYVFLNGSGFEGVTVQAGSNNAITDQIGFYSIPIAEGTFTVQATRTGYSSSPPQIVAVNSGQTIAGINFTMYPNASIITGIVEHAGNGIAGALVTGIKVNTGNPVPNTISDNNGNYELNLLPGQYLLWAEKDGFICATGDTLTITVGPGQNLPGMDIQLSPYECYLGGTVFNDWEQPLHSALITALRLDAPYQQYTTISDIAGNYALILVPGHAYRVSAQKNGYSEEEQITDILPQDSTTQINFVLIPLLSSISGNVQDLEGQPLVNATVEAVSADGSYQVQTALNGYYEINVSYGEYVLTVVKLGYIPESILLSVNPGAEIENIDFWLQDNFASLQGIITDESTQQPISAAMITADLTSRNTVFTDSNGFYQINGLLPGMYDILVTRTAYEDLLLDNIVIPGGTVIELDASLIPLGAQLDVYVSISRMRELADVTINVENAGNGTVTSGVTDDDGFCSIDGLMSNVPLQVTAVKVNYFAPDTIVTLLPAQTDTLFFQLELLSGSISGTVSEPDGTPLSAVQVIAASTDGFYGSGTSNSDGSYIINNLIPFSEYLITAELAGYCTLSDTMVFLAEEQVIVDLTLYPLDLSLSGHIVDQAGIALNGVQVQASSSLASGLAITDSYGYFTITALAPYQAYQVSTLIYQQGYNNTTITAEMGAESLDIGNLTVQVHISRFSGFILDADTAEPVTGATVNALNNGTGVNYSTLSQPDGYYSLNYLFEGNYDLKVQKDSYQQQMVNLNLGHRQTLYHDFTLQYSVPVTVSGLVIDTDDRPMAGIVIRLVNQQQEQLASSGPTGEFEFIQVLPYTDNILSTDMPSFMYDNAVCFFSLGTEDLEVNLVIDVHGATVTGKITNVDDEAVPGVEVSLSSDSLGYQDITGMSGLFDFYYLYEGNYIMNISRAGYQDTLLTFDLADFDSLQQDMVIQYEAGNISGLVTNPLSQNIRNAVVKIYQDEIEVGRDTTGAGGSFSVGGLPALFGYGLSSQKRGYQIFTNSEPVYVDSQEVHILMHPYPSTILGTVTFQNMETAGCSVMIRSLPGNIQTTSSNLFGDYHFSNVYGYYDIWANLGDSLVSYTTSVFVEEESFVIEHLALMPASHITGSVLYNGTGKPGITLYAVNTGNGRIYSDVTDLDGLYDITGITPGNYQIDIGANGFIVNEDLPQISLQAGETVNLPAFTLTFILNSIIGTVFQAQCRDAIAGVRIQLWDGTTLIDSVLTGPDGSFLFTDLADGCYVITAFHQAYQDSEPIDMMLLNGMSTPPTANFQLVHIELNVYGTVTDHIGIPLPGVLVEAVLLPDSGLSRIVFSDTTGSSGQYSVGVDTTGLYSVSTSRAGYINSVPVEVLLDYEENSYHLDFVLFPEQQFAALQGEITVYDSDLQQYYPPDNALITLQDGQGQISEIFMNYPQTFFQYQQLPVPDIFSLEITAEYSGQDYFRFIPGIIIAQQDTLNLDISFTYDPLQVNMSGFIRMQDEELLPLPGVQMTLYDSLLTVVDVTCTNSSGFYFFNGLLSDQYQLGIETTYKNEEFSAFIENIPWTGQNIQLDYTFVYILSRIDFLIMQGDNQPVDNAQVRVHSAQLEVIIYTNESGYCTTDNILPSDEYTVNISKNYGNQGRFIEPLSYNLSLDSLDYYQEMILLPLQYDENQLQEYNAHDEIMVLLQKSSTYTDAAYFHYFDVLADYHEIEMTADNEELLYVILPGQGSSGTLLFWFTSYSTDQGISFSSFSYPYLITVSSEGILSSLYSQILPDQPVFVFNQEAEFEVDLYDNSGNSLNQEVETGGIVSWSLSNVALGELFSHPDNNRKVLFVSPAADGGNIQGLIMAEVELDGVSMNLQETVAVKDMRLDRLIVEGPVEVSNVQGGIYNVMALSDSNQVMTLPIVWQEIPAYAGIITEMAGNIQYIPDSGYIGRFDLIFSASDPNYGHEVNASKKMTVYKKINKNNLMQILDTGRGSRLVLHENMLDTLKTEQARIYYYSRAVPPFKEIGLENEVLGNVFKLNSNRSQDDYLVLPGLNFDAVGDEEELYIAYWDNVQLKWVRLGGDVFGREYLEMVLEHVPLLSADYALITPSRELGIYDLKLRPNPFTPYDQIGQNMGLQIEFRLTSDRSRYPRITAQIYTVNGTLVRTIVKDLPMLKGNYQAGEPETLHWDGRTSEGKMARNGRYVIRLIAEDIEHRQELVRTVILIK